MKVLMKITHPEYVNSIQYTKLVETEDLSSLNKSFQASKKMYVVLLKSSHRLKETLEEMESRCYLEAWEVFDESPIQELKRDLQHDGIEEFLKTIPTVKII